MRRYQSESIAVSLKRVREREPHVRRAPRSRGYSGSSRSIPSPVAAGQDNSCACSPATAKSPSVVRRQAASGPRGPVGRAKRAAAQRGFARVQELLGVRERALAPGAHCGGPPVKRLGQCTGVNQCCWAVEMVRKTAPLPLICTCAARGAGWRAARLRRPARRPPSCERAACVELLVEGSVSTNFELDGPRRQERRVGSETAAIALARARWLKSSSGRARRTAAGLRKRCPSCSACC
jgi:hypothetical protein